MEILHNIFGGKTRVRIMRLFLLNPDVIHDVRSVQTASRGKRGEVEREIKSFEKVGLIRRRRYSAEGRKGKRVSLLGWKLNSTFIYLGQLRSLLLRDVLMKGHDIIRRLSRGAVLKLVVLSGVFIQSWDSRVDVLIVGDKLKKGILERTLRSMESEIGRELRYTILTPSDFQYRMSIGDKLVRDILDFPHQVVLNKGIIE